MTNDEKMALLREIVEATHNQPPPVSFTIEEYVALVRKETGEELSPDTVRLKLLKEKAEGRLCGKKFTSGGAARWHFWKPANNPQ